MAHDERPLWAKKLLAEEYELTQRGEFTVKAAAGYLMVSTRWVYDRIKEGSLPARKRGKGHRIQKRDLDRIMATEEGSE